MSAIMTVDAAEFRLDIASISMLPTVILVLAQMFEPFSGFGICICLFRQ